MNIEETLDQTVDEIKENDFSNVAVIDKPRLGVITETTKELLIPIDGVPKEAPISNRFRLPNAVIELRPIDKDTWHGKTGNDNFDRGSTIECAVFKSQYQTGLTQNEKDFLEAATGFDLSPNFNLNRDHTFYGTLIGRVKLENRTLIFDLSIPLDFIKYKLCIANPLVANSLEDFNTGITPLATHYIHSEEDVEATEIRLMSYIKEANKILAALAPKEQRMLLAVLNNSDVSNLGEEGVEAKLLAIIQKDVHRFISVAKEPKQLLQSKALLISAITKNIVGMFDNAYSYNSVNLGHDLESSAKYLINPEQQGLRMQIIEHVRNK